MLRIARLARAGYYNGLTFHRVAQNFVIQGGSPGANEYAGRTEYMRDELSAMILEDGKAEVICNFCRERYDFSETELETIRRETGKPPGPPS